MQKRKNMRIRRFSNPGAMRSEQLRYWRSRPGYERVEAISEITTTAYALKTGGEFVPRFQRSIRRIQRKQG